MIKILKKAAFLTAFVSLIFSCSASHKSAPAYAYESAPRAENEASGDKRMVTYSATLELTVKNADETRKLLIEYVKNYKGYVVKETERYITARIPADNMDNFIKVIKNVGKVETERKQGTDITDSYRDNAVRLKSLKAVRDRYWALLEAADGVKDMLSIETELERINTEIELLEGRIKYAELSVAYSDITIRLGEKTKPGPVGWVFYGLYYGIKWLFVWE